MRVTDKEIKSLIFDFDKKCEICIIYKKSKPLPAVAFPLAKTFNETTATDLEEWSHNKTVLLLHMIDHATIYSISCVINSKKMN